MNKTMTFISLIVFVALAFIKGRPSPRPRPRFYRGMAIFPRPRSVGQCLGWPQPRSKIDSKFLGLGEICRFYRGFDRGFLLKFWEFFYKLTEVNE